MESTTLRPFTSRTRVALAIARGLAAARGDSDLTPAHIAVGILREGANPAVAALWYAGLTEVAIRRLHTELEHSLGKPLGLSPPRQVTIDLTPGEEKVLQLSELEATRFDDEYLGTQHILLAILNFDDTVSNRFLQHGISAEQYTNALSSVRRGDPPPSEPAAV